MSKRNQLGILFTISLMTVLSSCSNSGSNAISPRAESAALWSAANERYLAGDYMQAVGNLEKLLDAGNPYAGRALPLSLVLTSGVAAGYIDVAECYSAGARANKAKAAAFRHKASVYRALANHAVLQFAEDAGKIETLTGSNIQLAFAPPRGNGATPPLFKRISNGIELEQSDEETTVGLAVERGVLASVTNGVGAANNVVKATSLLQRGAVLVPRAIFMKAIADSLERESQIYARNKLDDAAKIAMLKQLARSVQKDAPSSQSAAVLPISSH